jgi:hypothetical protein
MGKGSMFRADDEIATFAAARGEMHETTRQFHVAPLTAPVRSSDARENAHAERAQSSCIPALAGRRLPAANRWRTGRSAITVKPSEVRCQSSLRAWRSAGRLQGRRTRIHGKH